MYFVYIFVMFLFTQTSGRVTLQRPLDRETDARIVLDVAVIDAKEVGLLFIYFNIY